ncbi:hypothetical protein DCAR_0521752 [Daucus carota subsp. sativus]|uniref:Glucan endo-1,3-beta-D-glucosidase n=2 Tax=Daucus carota subsp. sativus TaxID=79200 RepID=A0A164ZDE7_DAUCS|nr:hypothetical protein DCAR_0521752 [Daucus carota subsp. sativus]
MLTVASLSLLLLLFTSSTACTTIGVSYTSAGAAASSPEHIAAVLRSHRISAVRLQAPEPSVIRAFTYSNISLLLEVPNHLVSSFASNVSAANLWLYTHVVPFYPRVKISAISVGSNTVSTSQADLSDVLIPAMQNLKRSLNSLGISDISVSTTFSFIDIMNNAFPPSSAEFQEPINRMLIRPLLQFLEENNSSFFVNLYPYKVYRLNSEIPVGFALFRDHPYNFRDDITTGVRYRNLFDMMVDAVIAAMTVSGHENIPLVVTETGWPSYNSGNEPEASHHYSEMYFQGLITHLKSGLGTPLRKEGVAEAYLYELFDNDDNNDTMQVTASGSGMQNWGIMYPNLTMKYNIPFSSDSKRFHGQGIAGMAALLLVISALL